uniref:Nitrile-specifier protein 5 n=2 Tax=Picea sitchensis TaxID=3332 RepID=C0PQW4_PICSI|nr:unknown [Picea sitchensis]
MAIMQGKWLQANQKEGGPKARSSHAVAVVGKKAYVFGGEVEPRVPVDNLMHVFDLEDNSWSVAEAKGDAPPPRVGVTMVPIGSVIYLFGGRDQSHKELNHFYSFDTDSCQWNLISSEADGPPNRSYHAMAADDKQVYVFGGCGEQSRLNDLWAFNVEEGEWKALPAPPPESKLVPRGGPGLVVLDNKVWVIFGFGGKHELPDIHCFDLRTNMWEEVEAKGEIKPTPRSVFACFALGKHIVVYGGEVDPSDLGHMGAGSFCGDVFALDTEALEWIRVEDGGGESHPGPRGWTAFSVGSCCGGNGMLVYGGNSPSNKRLDDIFFLQLAA